MSEQKPTARYVTSREHGVTWAEFKKHGCDISAQRSVMSEQKPTAQVRSIVTSRRKTLQEIKVIIALFGRGTWHHVPGELANKVSGELNGSNEKNCYFPKLKMSYDEFVAVAKIVFHRLGAKPDDVTFERNGEDMAVVDVKKQFYYASLDASVEMYKAACEQHKNSRPRPRHPTR
jgi:hypothetical protein